MAASSACDHDSHSTAAGRRLLLIPTAMERDRLVSAMLRRGDAGHALVGTTRIETCGFGVVAAAAMTMRYLDQHRPIHVILAGIAGSLGPECEVGSAYWFDEVVCDGIGVGSEDSYLSATVLGWNHLDADASGEPIGDRLGLHLPESSTEGARSPGLLTRCAASPTLEDAQAARRRAEQTCLGKTFAAEDMEGFAVALACQVAGVPLSIVRGISNEAGDRNHSTWKTAPALDGVAEQLCSLDAID
ncbi:futalosine hydrolase [Allorhodopirellula heiligendammensis]|nr:futalosine hydrolase [Allorhodopirellula heiligendammensis]